MNSDPSSVIQARSNLYLHRLNSLSDLAGKFGATDVQQQRMIVKTQVNKILHVPRPSGSLTQPRGVGMVSFILNINLMNSVIKGQRGLYIAIESENQRAFRLVVNEKNPKIAF